LKARSLENELSYSAILIYKYVGSSYISLNWSSNPQELTNPDTYKRVVKPSIAIILPNVSINGVAKTGLKESSILDANVDVISLVKERSEYPSLTNDLSIKYVSRSEIISRLIYPHCIYSLDIGHTDIIIAHNNPSLVIAHRLYKKSRIPYIAYIHDAEQVSVHGTLPKFGKKEIKEALSSAALVLSNSRRNTIELETIYDVKDATVLYPGCTPSQSIKQERSDFYLVVHMVSLSINFRVLYNLLKKNKDINIIIAGAKKYSWQAVYIAFKAKFGHRVKFVFNPTEQAISELYMRSKMLLHTAIENFGLSPLEAAGYGTPSAVVRGSGVLEVLEENNEILSYDGNKIEELDTLIKDYSCDSKISSLGQKAWRKAQKYDWDSHVQTLQHKIDDIIARR
jgi:glycosyltransferase involved in cell wall biosynthesis